MSGSPPPDRPVINAMVNGSEIRGMLRSVDIEDHDRLIDRARIVVQDADNVCTDFNREGQRVLIELGWGTQRAPIFEGYIRHVEGLDGRDYPSTVTLTALDPSYFMHLNTRLPRAFPNRRSGTPAKLSEIIRFVVREYAARFSVGEIVVETDVEFSESDPLIQRNETDLQFLYRIANLYGARCFVEYNRQSGQERAASQFYFISERRLMSGDRLATLRYCHGVSEIINFSYERVSSDAEPQRTAVAVNPADGVAPPAAPPPATEEGAPPPDIAARISHIEQQLRSADSYRAAAAAVSRAPVQPADLRHHYADTGLPSNPNLIQAVTRQDPTRVLGLRGRGEAVGNAHLRAKSKIGIIGFSVWDEGDWYVHKVRHMFSQERDGTSRSYRTKFEVSR